MAALALRGPAACHASVPVDWSVLSAPPRTAHHAHMQRPPPHVSRDIDAHGNAPTLRPPPSPSPLLWPCLVRLATRHAEPSPLLDVVAKKVSEMAVAAAALRPDPRPRRSPARHTRHTPRRPLAFACCCLERRALQRTVQREDCLLARLPCRACGVGGG